MQHLKGPDFPTGGIILGREGIREAYRSGRGRIVMRARAHIEELRGGKTAIIVTELPYGVKKGGDDGVIAKIADLVNDEGAHRDLRRIAGPLRQDRHADRHRAEARRGAAGRAEQALQAHLAADDVRLQRRRARRRRAAHAVAARAASRTTSTTSARSSPAGSKFELRNAVRRAHILEGYLIALDNLDAVIALIRALGRHRGRRARADGAVRPQRAPGAGDPRHAARAPHRARAQAGRGRVRRPAGADRRAARRSSATRRRSTA